jgi:hypothetical protein
MIYKCFRCGKDYNYKNDIRRHYNRKNPCRVILRGLTQKECISLLDPPLEVNKVDILEEQNKNLIDIVEKLQKRLTKLENNNNKIINNNIQEIVVKQQKENKILKEKIKDLEIERNIQPDTNHFIYIIKEREFIKTNEEIYKIGKTRGLRNRIGDYPKGSAIKMVYPCKDIDIIEKELLLLFDEQFIRMVDVGREYFRGDINVMVNLVTNHITSKTETEVC